MPKEHGSWSLALEPVVFGLLVAPSVAGLALAAAVLAAFFSRRPLKIAVRDARSERRSAARGAVLACALAAAAGFLIAVSLAGFEWCVWLIPSALLGTLFLSFDLRNSGREEAAEIAGSAAFAALPAALAIIGGREPVVALAVAVLMIGRAVPTVCCVRAALRAAKTGECRRALPLAASAVALLAGAIAAWRGLAPWIAVGCLGYFLVRTFAILVFPRPVLRARTIGIHEAITGVAFVIFVGLLWPA